LIGFIKANYLSYGTQKIGDKVIFDKLENPSDLLIKTPKTVIPFKRILWPNKAEVDSLKAKREDSKKFAFIGLTNCDARALDIFLKEYEDFDLLPKREDILIVSTECKSDENCFCTAFGFGKIEIYDLHIQTDKDGFAVFAKTAIGRKILKEVGIKETLKKPELREIKLPEIDRFHSKEELSKAINEKQAGLDFWTKVANNCFACGACTATCPLCFCTRQDFSNQADGSAKLCLNWDTCFSKSFSEIAYHLDFRPENVDRLYNWYHHKFVRAYHKKKHFLCSGCGRCIKACPANLNQYRIISTIYKKFKH
jgi:ferredoxin